MKKGLIGVAIAIVVLMVLFTACDKDKEPQDVNLVGFSKAQSVAFVTATQIGSNYYVLVSWDAVENGSNYDLYYKQEGKKTVNNYYAGTGSRGVGPQNRYTITTSSITSSTIPQISTTANTDIDKWSAVIDVQYNTYSGLGVPTT